MQTSYATQQTVYVSANTATVYEEASKDSKSLGVMPFGEDMTLLESDGQWVKVKNGSGGEGYALSSDLTLSNPNHSAVKYHTTENADGYKKPSTSYSKNITYNKNDIVSVVAITSDGDWARVATESGYTYIQTKYLEKGEPNSNSAETETVDTTYSYKTMYVTANILTAYKSADTSSASLGSLAFGDKILLIEDMGNGWSRVQNSAGTYGWCKSSLISLNDPRAAEKTYIVNEKTYGYTRPESGLSIKSTYAAGTEVRVSGITKDGVWARVETGSSRVYVRASALSASGSDEDEEIDNDEDAKEEKKENEKQTEEAVTNIVYVKSNSVTVYKSAKTSAKALFTMYFGEPMTYISESGIWAKVQNSTGTQGWCKKSAITESNPCTLNDTYAVSLKQAYLYSGASSGTKKIGTLANGEKMTVLGFTASKSWTRVNYNGTIGYVKASYIKKSDNTSSEDIKSEEITEENTEEIIEENTERTAYVNADILTFYKSSSASSGSCGSLGYGTAVTVISENGIWSYVRNESGSTAYCKSASLTATDPSGTPRAYSVTAKSQSVFSKPSTSSKNLASLASGDTVYVVATIPSGTWYRVMVSGAYGFIPVSSASLKTDESEPIETSAPAEVTVYVYSDTLTVYKDKSTSSKSLGTMSFGDSMTCTAIDGAWAGVRNSAGAEGWCNAADLTTTAPKTINATYYIKTANTPCYAAANEKSSIKIKLAVDTAVTATLLSKNGDWAKITYSGKTYYAKISALSTVNSTSDSSYDDPLAGTADAKIEKAIETAWSTLGMEYKWGGKKPPSFDCIGLVHYCYAQAGISVPSSTSSINSGTKFTKVTYENLKRGDILCFDCDENGQGCDHVGLYLGGGDFINASSSKKMVIKCSFTSFYKRTLLYALRVVE